MMNTVARGARAAGVSGSRTQTWVERTGGLVEDDHIEIDDEGP